MKQNNLALETQNVFSVFSNHGLHGQMPFREEMGNGFGLAENKAQALLVSLLVGFFRMASGQMIFFLAHPASFFAVRVFVVAFQAVAAWAILARGFRIGAMDFPAGNYWVG